MEAQRSGGEVQRNEKSSGGIVLERLEIFKEEDRLAVAAVLVKNGYRVSQGKERTTPKGKSYTYFLEYEKAQKKEEKDV